MSSFAASVVSDRKMFTLDQSIEHRCRHKAPNRTVAFQRHVAAVVGPSQRRLIQSSKGVPLCHHQRLRRWHIIFPFNLSLCESCVQNAPPIKCRRFSLWVARQVRCEQRSVCSPMSINIVQGLAASLSLSDPQCVRIALQVSLCMTLRVVLRS